MTKQKPIHQLKIGRVRASIWENPGKNGAFCTVTIGRLFKKGDDWKSTTSLSADDLLAAAKALNEAHSFILSQADSAGRSK